ncbi:MAG: hypothetical protein MUP02_05055 [Actinobacteria bacterium]|nr:hypothetical protein [Actinomycetota bacterium]
MLIKRRCLLIVFIVIILAMVFIVSGCKENEAETVQIPSEGLYTRCIKVKEKIPHDVIEASLEYYDEDTLFKNSDLIFKGIVVDENTIGIEEYINGELERTYYRDSFTFEIEKIYYSEDPSLEVGDVIKVSNASCSYWWVEGTLKMEKGSEYIVITIKRSDLPDVEFSKCYDYYVENYWVPIIPIEDDKYYVDEELTSLTGNAEEEIIRKDGSFKTTVYVKGEEFEEELEDLILEKKS